LLIIESRIAKPSPACANPAKWNPGASLSNICSVESSADNVFVAVSSGINPVLASKYHAIGVILCIEISTDTYGIFPLHFLAGYCAIILPKTVI
jgi:hypothetical protein